MGKDDSEETAVYQKFDKLLHTTDGIKRNKKIGAGSRRERELLGET